MAKRRPDKLPVTGSSQVVDPFWEEQRCLDGSRVSYSNNIPKGDVPQNGTSPLYWTSSSNWPILSGR